LRTCWHHSRTRVASLADLGSDVVKFCVQCVNLNRACAECCNLCVKTRHRIHISDVGSDCVYTSDVGSDCTDVRGISSHRIDVGRVTSYSVDVGGVGVDCVNICSVACNCVDVGSVKTWLQNRIDDLGGGKEGIANLSSEEKRLWATVSKANPTYAALNEQRDLIGQALEKTTGPWANSNTKKLKEIYGALADDQINFIESTAGKEIADKQRAANTLFKQMYEGREQMERLYGKNLSGSIAPLMQRAITEGGKGNVQSFNTLVKIIPEDMRGSVLSSALFKAAGTTDEKFSFTKFADLYKGLRDNSVVYKQFAEAVGPEGDKLLTDFYAISRRLSDADKAIQRTGASTQLDLLNSERLITQIVKSVGAGSAVAGVTSLVGGDVATGVFGALAAVAPQIASKYGKTNVEKLHNLMKSEEFRELAVSAATGDNLNKNINRVAGSKTFREYAKIANIDMKDARNWLNSAISKGATIAGTEAIGEKPSEAPTVEMPQ